MQIKLFIKRIISKQVKYNKSFYTPYGDVKGKRTLKWFNEFVGPLLTPILMSQKFNLCLDVGCGNGRMFPYLSKYVRNVIGIDICDDFNVKFKTNNSIHMKTDLFKYDNKHDLIFLFGTVGILEINNNKEKLKNKVNNLMQPNALIISIHDKNVRDNFLLDLNYKTIKEISVDKDTILLILKKYS